MAQEYSPERPLFGGTISCSFPVRFEDVSNLRQVRDHQEKVSARIQVKGQVPPPPPSTLYLTRIPLPNEVTPLLPVAPIPLLPWIHSPPQRFISSN